MQYDWCPYKKEKGWRCDHTEKRPCEDTARRWPFADLGERLQKKPNLPALFDLGLLGLGTVNK